MEDLHAWISVYLLPKAPTTRTEVPHPSSGDFTHCFQSLSSSNLKLGGIREAQEGVMRGTSQKLQNTLFLEVSGRAKGEKIINNKDMDQFHS